MSSPPPPPPKPTSDVAALGPRENESVVPPPLPPKPRDIRLATTVHASSQPTRRIDYERYLEWSPWLVSFTVHFVTIFLLGLITYMPRPGRPLLQLVASGEEAASDSQVSDIQPTVNIEPDRRRGASREDAGPEIVSVEVPLTEPARPSLPQQSVVAANVPRSSPAEHPSAAPSEHGRNPLRPTGGFAAGGGLEGRNQKGRANAVARGGSRLSEAAVEKGLQWLVAHQRDDGGWCFDLSKAPCNGQCRNSGSEASTTAATSLALLPFLGAGYTHTEGEYRDTVNRGLYYLATRAKVTPHGADLQEGTMYAQALSTLTLCEAYAMTRDPTLKDLAQQAINFIVFAQDPKGGGWRYSPGAPGDVTVTGWHLMALKSGQLAKLNVPSPMAGMVRMFLDSVQTDGGAKYNYMVSAPPRQTTATTAIGLLCRMYTGWQRDNPALYKGVAYLHKWGPSRDNMYYNYYATQVLHHWEGPEWEAWNRRMRDYLVATQAVEGHESGSWYFDEPYGRTAGRLYNTSLAILTLEVYYRYSPIYGAAAVQDQF